MTSSRGASRHGRKGLSEAGGPSPPSHSMGRVGAGAEYPIGWFPASAGVGSDPAVCNDEFGVLMKRLVIFDVDGTLTLSMALDARLYVRAVEEVLGRSEISTD